jgi:Bacterial regulatory proteins, gntR family
LTVLVYVGVVTSGLRAGRAVDTRRYRSVVGVNAALDPARPVALYVQLAGVLLARIQCGEITGRLPSVLELVEAFGVARGTANKALMHLAAGGHATLIRGRGYWVSSDPNITSGAGSTMPAVSVPNRRCASSAGASGS